MLLRSFGRSPGVARRAVAAYVAAGLAAPALMVLLYWCNGALPELRFTPGAVVRRAGYALSLACVATALWTASPSALTADPGGFAESHYVRRAARVVAAARRPGDDIWALRHHLILWYLDMPSSIAPLIHPSLLYSIPVHILSRDEYDPVKRREHLLATPPSYIVTDSVAHPADLWYLDDEAADDVRNLVDNHYSVFYDDGRIRIYKRLERP